MKPDLVFTEKGISDLAQHFLLKAGITAIRRLKKTDNNRLARFNIYLNLSLNIVSVFVVLVSSTILVIWERKMSVPMRKFLRLKKLAMSEDDSLEVLINPPDITPILLLLKRLLWLFACVDPRRISSMRCYGTFLKMRDIFRLNGIWMMLLTLFVMYYSILDLCLEEVHWRWLSRMLVAFFNDNYQF